MIMKNKDNIYNKIINVIKKNRISTTEIADCLGKKGSIEGVCAINTGHFRVGRVFLTYAYNKSNWELHEQIREVEEGSILIVESYDCDNKAIFGDLVSKYLVLYKGVSAIVVNGYMRDAHRLKKENYPIWCKGVTPIGCFNIKNKLSLDSKIIKHWRSQYDGSIAVCDDGGVVVIPKAEINNDLIEKLAFIELQEDIWYHCIDTKKWSTYDTVCLKKYLNTKLLPSELKKRFEIFIEKIDKK